MRDKENFRQKLFTRRALVLGGFQFSLMSVLIGRLGYLQLIKSETYKTLSDNNHIKLLLIPPIRGHIQDRFGVNLATNKSQYRVLIDKVDNPEYKIAAASALNLLDIDDLEKEQILKKVKAHRKPSPIMLYDDLDWKDVVKIEVNTPDLPGVLVDVGMTRSYHFVSSCSHILGYVGSASEEDIELKQMISHPDFQIGKYGVEKACDEILQGDSGIRKIEVNAFGHAIRELSREEAVSGKNVRLSIDIRLQDYISNLLDSRGAAAVVMDVTNGEVLASVSTPGFDPNEFVGGISSEYWKKVINDKRFPLINKTVSTQYPPGSVFKVVSALAALEAGIPETAVFNCPGYYTLGNRKFHCWREHGHGNLNLRQALMHSCNVYFFNVARKIGIEKLHEVAKFMGLGDRSGIELTSESMGNMPNRRWKRDRYKQDWMTGDSLNAIIGQGYILTTPVQLALMISRLAGGKLIKPTLLLGENHKDIKDLPFNPKHVQIVRDGLNMVTNIPGGTAYASRIVEEHFAMAGKTGTAQVISKKSVHDDFSGSDVAWENRNHGLFVGFAPVHNPKYGVSVVVEHGGSGSKAAAPLGRDILAKTQKMYS